MQIIRWIEKLAFERKEKDENGVNLVKYAITIAKMEM